MEANRFESLPVDLLDLLRAEADTDLLDFPALEWALEHEQVEDAVDGAIAAQMKAEPTLQGAAYGLPLQQAHSSGGETGDAFVSAAGATSAIAAHPNNQFPRLSHGTSHSDNNLTSALVAAQQADEEEHDATTRQPPKKKRTRNAEQMAQNREAQKKYRERKKQEQQELQDALDRLTAQLAIQKAMEASAAALKQQNEHLTAVVSQQTNKIAELSVTVERQATELAAAQQQAAEMSALAASQQRMILDQHNRLQLQEEVIEQLKGRLQEKLDHAFEGRDPKTVCQRMVAAVRAALEGARNMEGLQESLAQLPDDVVTDVCRAILCEVKKMWPELEQRINAFHEANGGKGVCASRCGQEVQWATCGQSSA